MRVDAIPPEVHYEPPKILEEEVFEHLALACTMTEQGPACGVGGNYINSTTG